MRLPSLDLLTDAARRAGERFPMVLVSAVVAALSASFLVEEVGEEYFLRFLAAGTLGLPLFLALELFAERRRWIAWRRALVWLVGLLALGAFVLAWPNWSSAVQGRRYLQLSAALHLLAAFLPFVGRSETNGFWQYNRALLERAIVAVIYAATLYAGVALAVGALDRLLGVPFPDETYAHLWFAAAFVFSTWFFVAGVPRDLAALDARTEYPGGLKRFVQYLLIPIVVAYLLILTLYLAKIVITTQWPSGWIGYLVSSVAVVGILSVLLIHPIAEREENRWITTYVRWFYVGLVPAIVMLLLALWKRIDQYGITENRYFMVGLALWLAAIAAYYVATRSRNIKLIPMSLCVLAVATLAGPWSAYAVSERSQAGRLRGLLEANGMWHDGRVEPVGDREVPVDERREMAAVLEYLASTHGTDAVDEWFGAPVAPEPVPANVARRRTRSTLEQLGLAYVGPRRGRGGYLGYSATGPVDVPVASYERAIVLTGHGALPTSVVTDGYAVRIDTMPPRIRVSRDGGPPLQIGLDTLWLHQGAFAGDSARPAIVLETAADAMRVAVIVWQFDGQQRDSAYVLRGLRGQVLVGR